MAINYESDIVYNIDVDFHSLKHLDVVYTKQYDENSRYIVANVWKDSEIYTIPDGAIAIFACTKRDNNGIFNQCIIENNQIIYPISLQTTILDGNLDAEFRLYKTIDNGDGTTMQKLLSTPKFKIRVDKSALDDNTVISTNEFNALTDAMNSVGDLIFDMNDAISRTETAITDAETATTNANTATTNANTATTNANNAASLANEKAGLADTATQNAITATNNAIDATSDVNTAITNAQTATTNANNAATNANDKATIADTAATNANNIATQLEAETLKIFKPAVSLFTDLATTYPTPENGWTVTVNGEEPVVSYRWNGTEWVNLGVISSVDKATNTTLGIVKGGGNINIDANGVLNAPEIGDLSLLQTVSKTDLVGGINENKGRIDTNTTDIGDKTVLNTTEKSNLVGAVNEVDDRLTTIESQGTYSDTTLHNDYKSIFTTGTGKDNLSADQDFSDIVSGQSNVRLEGLTGNNAVTNGDFSNGTTGWSGLNGTLSAVNNTLSLTGDGTSQSPIIYQNFSNKIINNKFFYMAKVKVTNSNAEYIKLECLNATTTDSTVRVDNPTQNTLYKLYGIFTYNSTSGNFRVREFYADATTANGKVMEVKDVVAIDLTALGLDTLTKEQCDFMYDHYINGLQGVGSGKIVSIGKNKFDGQLEEGRIDSNTGIPYVAATHVRSKNFQRVQPNNNYKMTSIVSNWVFYDANKNYISNIMSVSSFTTPSNCYYVKFERSKQADGILEKLQIEEGSTATAYEPYQSTELIYTLPQKLYRLPNGVVDTVDEINNVKQVTYQTKEYVLQSGDISGLYTTNANNDYCTFSYANMTGINAVADGTGFRIITDKTSPRNNATFDSSTTVWMHYQNPTNGVITFPKGTYASLSAAQTALAGTKIIYQLAVPVTYKNGENGFSVTGNIEAYPNGTIYQEPVTIKESCNAKIYTTYNLSDKAVTMQNSAEISAINKRMSDWKTVNPWIAPTLLNGWVNYGGTADTVGYYKDEFGIVHLKGFVKSGTIGQAIFNLPVGYRPNARQYYSALSNGLFGYATIISDGTVQATSGSNVSFSLDGISFKAVN
jgi:hypothetical protein